VTPLLEVTGLCRVYRQGEARVAVLDGLDLVLGAGERLALTGRSGSGKSTLLNLIAGLDAPDAGRVVWHVDGHPVELGGLDEDGRTRLRRRHLGFVFQAFNLVPTLTAQENVALLAELNGLEDADARAAERLAAVGLGHRRHALPETLSGGEQQRVAVARALVHDPACVLADEPTGSLDAETGDAVFAALDAAVDEAGAALVLVTHDAALAARTDRRLDLGRAAP
jgi:putative ABC transport system ATP-binding protein